MAKRKDTTTPLLGKPNIAAMPPECYSGDKPNPHLRAFVEDHLRKRPLDLNADKYATPAFNKQIETTKATSIYNMHTYWSKKPHDAIRQYIRHYTAPGDLVLDPFCGSGGTALAALLEGRKAIAIDRSPAASFITKNYCTPVDTSKLDRILGDLRARVHSDMEWLYGTRCDRCNGQATITFTVYSQTFKCTRCLNVVPIAECVEKKLLKGETGGGKSGVQKLCPFCHKKGQAEPIKPRGELKKGSIPITISYVCNQGCKPSRSERSHSDSIGKRREFFSKYDASRLSEIEKGTIPYWFPTNSFLRGDRYHRDGLIYNNIDTVADLYTKRNLWALASILHHIEATKEYKDVLLFAFTSNLLKASRMMAHNSDGIGRIQKGTYYLPQVLHDINVWRFMEEAIGDLISGYEAIGPIAPELRVSTSNAQSIDIPSNSVDYIFTDPPYAEKVQYGELNFVWECWLRADQNWLDDEIIVNEFRGKSPSDWNQKMAAAIAECYRVLKPGRWISLCYHDTSEGTWALLQDMMAEAGFVSDDSDQTLFIDTKTKTTNQYFADKVTKRDLVLNFRKPKPGEIKSIVILTGTEDDTTFREKTLIIIRDFLQAKPGSTKDRIYDEVVSRLVRKGRMEAFNFDALLAEVAEPLTEELKKNLFEKKEADLLGTHEIKRWYLKESADTVDAAESAKEESCAKKLEAFMVAYLKKNSDKTGVHYSDMFEQILTMDRPRREMAEWLWDYFYKTEEGTWRPPETEEERLEKRQQRTTGALRKIKSFAKLLDESAPVPPRLKPDSDRTLADWIRQARRAGLFAQGKTLFEKGGLNLSKLEQADENLAMDVNEDYQFCVKQLSTGA